MKNNKGSSRLSRIIANANHYRMERFTVMFMVLIISLIVVSGICLKQDFVKKASSFATKAMYTTNFKTSKTDIYGNVVGVYTNKNKTRAFLLINFNDVGAISTDATQYKAFLTGADVSRNKRYVSGNPAGSIYMFGTTGYMGVYLVNNDGFSPQILDLTIRSMKQLKSTNNTVIDPEYNANNKKASEDPSFDKNDQFRIYFNPGANDAKVIECLNDNSQPTVKDLFDQTVGVEGMKEAVLALNHDLDQMSTFLSQIEEYSRRLDKQDNVQLPDTPKFISGDSIIRNDNGTKDDISDDKYDIKFVTMSEGGYDLDWQGKKLSDDLLGEAMRNDNLSHMTIEQYFAKKNSDRNSSAINGLGSTSNIVWNMKDGTPLESLNTGSNTGRYATINNDVQLLINAWQNYSSLKLQYQTVNLERLISLNAVSKMVSDSTTINTKDDVLRLY